MAIKVTLGEAQTQENHFPKLMARTYDNGEKIEVVEVHESINSPTGYIGIWRTGLYKNIISYGLHVEGLKDFTGTITLQNA